MRREKKIEQLRRVQKVDAPPYLLTRVRAKIRSEAIAEHLPHSWWWAGAAAFVLLLLLNATVFFAPRQTPAADLVEQYGLHQTQQVYADEN
ncbi:MAG: hypothetical protein ABMA02_12850 [Saprospiraceae bacterium]